MINFTGNIPERYAGRPYLFMALASSLLGTSLAYGDGIHSWIHAAFALLLIFFTHFIFTATNLFGKLDPFISKYPLYKAVFIFVLTGPACLAGTYLFQSDEINPAVMVASFIPGLLTVSLFLSRRDYKTIDAHRLKDTVFLSLLISAACVPVIVYFITLDHIWTLSAVAVLFLYIPIFMRLPANKSHSRGKGFTLQILRVTIAYYALFSLGWII